MAPTLRTGQSTRHRRCRALQGRFTGRQSGVRTVGADAELQSTYDALTTASEPSERAGCDGTWMRRPDGVELGLLGGSASGGRTIDIRFPDGTNQEDPYRMSGFDDRTLLEDLLANGVDDWVYEALVCGNIARRVADHPNDRRAVAIGLIAAAVLGGYMEAGSTPGGERGFVPWGVEPGEATLRVAMEWMARDAVDVGPGEIVWLRNTAKGDAVGRSVLDRESA